MRKVILILNMLFYVVAGYTQQQEVEFKVFCKSPLVVGELFTVEYSINALGGNLILPSNMTGISLISGPQRSSQSSTQIINGKITRSVNNTFYYTMQAVDEGEFVIDPATIKVDGKEYECNPLKVKVQKAPTTSNVSTGQNAVSGNQNRGSASEEIKGDNKDLAFLKVDVSNSNPYIGEQVVIRYFLCYRVDITNYELTQRPEYPGCWTQDIEQKNNRNRNQSIVSVNGVNYHSVELFSEVIFPQKQGKLTSKPLEMNIIARVQDDNARGRRDPFESFFGDSFFSSSSRNIKQALTSNPIELRVKDFPMEGKPDSFKGNVGDFSVKAFCSDSVVEVNTPITFTYQIKGRGNLSFLDALDVHFPAIFDAYDPDIENKINVGEDLSVKGSKQIKYLVIPRSTGEYSVAPLEFSYFDPQKKVYKTVMTEAFHVRVNSPSSESYDRGLHRSVDHVKKDVQYLGSDIRYIKVNIKDMKYESSILFNSKKFYWILILMVAFFLLSVFGLILFRKKKGSITEQKERRANKVAQKHLSMAVKHMRHSDSKAFYEAIATALWGYASDKFNLDRVQMSLDVIHDLLTKKAVDDRLADSFIRILEECEYARFSPENSDKNMAELYNAANDIIVQIEKELK